MAAEERLIDANALLEKVQYRVEVKGMVGTIIRDQVEITRKLIEDAPTVPAFRVTRCKDCTHWRYTGEGLGDCTHARFTIPGVCNNTMAADDFCCLGERREGHGNL